MAEVAAPVPSVSTKETSKSNSNLDNDPIEARKEPEKPITKDGDGNAKDSEPKPSMSEEPAKSPLKNGVGQDEDPKNQSSPTRHTDDRRDNDSKRVLEAKKWNNRDQNRHHEKGNDRKPMYFKKKNNKFDPSQLPKSDDPKAIRKQIEFYFSDSNLLTDKFLFNTIEGHKNKPVPVDLIHSFKRMQRFQPRLAIVSALKESTTLNLVNDDNDIQRKTPLPDHLSGKSIEEVRKVHEDESMARSIYAKGFGREEHDSQLQIEDFFKEHGKFNSVRLRRGDDGFFKGSVFVEFSDEETAIAFLALDPRPEYRGKRLLMVKSKRQYCDEKVEEINASQIRRNSPGPPKYPRDKDSRNNNHRGADELRDDDWRKKKAEDAKNGFQDPKGGSRRGGKNRGFGSWRGRGGKGHDRGRDRGRSASPGKGSKSEPKYAPAHEKSDSNAQKTGDESSAAETARPKNIEEPSAPDASRDSQKGTENASAVPKEAGTVTSAPTQAPKDGDEPKAETSSKKRPREDDELTEDTREAKKVDKGDKAD